MKKISRMKSVSSRYDLFHLLIVSSVSVNLVGSSFTEKMMKTSKLVRL